jgi:hypothetical protein
MSIDDRGAMLQRLVTFTKHEDLKLKDAQFRTKDGGMLYKIGVHGKIFMWVNDNWILSKITRSELAARAL